MQALSDLPFIAGHVALDLVNTAEERGHPEAGDILLTAADLWTWGQRYDLLSAARSGHPGDAAELARARAARELLYAIFLAHTRDRPATVVQLAELGQLAAQAFDAGTLIPALGGSVSWRWSRDDLSSVRHVAVAAAVDLLGRDLAGRLKQCPGDHCGWFFLDATKRGNRRWCSMDECGQDAKDERRRARRRDGGAVDPPSSPQTAADPPRASPSSLEGRSSAVNQTYST